MHDFSLTAAARLKGDAIADTGTQRSRLIRGFEEDNDGVQTADTCSRLLTSVSFAMKRYSYANTETLILQICRLISVECQINRNDALMQQQHRVYRLHEASGAAANTETEKRH